MHLIALFLMFLPLTAMADVLSLYDALRATYTACVGIDDELADLKKMAGINTAVTGVGTAAGVGATATGLVKASKDKEIEELEIKLEKLREIESKSQTSDSSDYDSFVSEFETQYGTITQQLKNYQTEIDKLTEQSKKLGDWRTGLLAGSTATNIAGAAIAGNNKVNIGLREQIKTCVSAVDTLKSSVAQARLKGEDISEAQNIISACEEYKYIDLSKIDNRAKGAMISSVVGASTGVSGTVTSAFANSKDIRENDDNAKKEKGLNTAANILSGVTTAASATATGFNAAQISAIKKVVDVAEKCTGVLK